MTSRHDILLEALYGSLELAGAGTLEPERVTGLGAALGLQPEETLELAERLRGAGLIEFRWGGKVALTEKGMERASGRRREPAIHLESGSTYVGAGAHVSDAAVGAGAMAGITGQGAVARGGARIDLHPGELAAALSELRRAQALLGPAEQELVRQLEGGIQETLDEANQASPDRAALEKHLDRTKGLLERVAGISEAAGKLGPALKLIAKGLGLAGVAHLL